MSYFDFLIMVNIPSPPKNLCTQILGRFIFAVIGTKRSEVLDSELYSFDQMLLKDGLDIKCKECMPQKVIKSRPAKEWLASRPSKTACNYKFLARSVHAFIHSAGARPKPSVGNHKHNPLSSGKLYLPYVVNVRVGIIMIVL